jgi:hypothetical protein
MDHCNILCSQPSFSSNMKKENPGGARGSGHAKRASKAGTVIQAIMEERFWEPLGPGGGGGGVGCRGGRPRPGPAGHLRGEAAAVAAVTASRRVPLERGNGVIHSYTRTLVHCGEEQLSVGRASERPAVSAASELHKKCCSRPPPRPRPRVRVRAPLAFRLPGLRTRFPPC